MTGSGPSAGAAALNIGREVLGGVQTGLSMGAQIKALKTPKTGIGPGTSQD
jgi:hypothetical protein